MLAGAGDLHAQQAFLLSPGDPNTPLPRGDSQTFNGGADAGAVPANMYALGAHV